MIVCAICKPCRVGGSHAYVFFVGFGVWVLSDTDVALVCATTVNGDDRRLLADGKFSSFKIVGVIATLVVVRFISISFGK